MGGISAHKIVRGNFALIVTIRRQELASDMGTQSKTTPTATSSICPMTSQRRDHLTNDLASVKRSVAGFQTMNGDGRFGYGTEGSLPIRHAENLLESIPGGKFVVLLTDGEWSSPDVAISQSRACKASDVEIIAVGICDADKNFLRKIATSDQNAMKVDLSRLSSEFSKIGRVISETKSVTPKKEKTK